MASPIEIRQSHNEEIKLSRAEVDQNAFDLIEQFKASFELRKPKDSTRRPERYIHGDLSIGKVRYRAFYNHFGGLVDLGTRWFDFQGLQIDKDVRGESSHDVVTDRLYLLSRRPQDQQFSPLADLTFHGNIPKHPVDVFLRFNDLYRARPIPLQEQEYVYVKTPSALQKAHEMLTELSLQAP